jgi:hypothetical protein
VTVGVTARVRWNKDETQVTSNNWTSKHTNSTKTLIERMCKAKRWLLEQGSNLK